MAALIELEKEGEIFEFTKHKYASSASLGLVKGKVRKEVKQSLRELEHKLSSSSRPSGNPRYVGLGDDDKESYMGKGWKLDL